MVLRISYDEGWHATVDGRPSRVYVADGFLMGVPVGPGQHDIRITYLDRAVTNGMRLGFVVWFILLTVWGALQAGALARRRWARPVTNASP